MVRVISIIIPVYNVAPYIADCLQSVMRQTYEGSLECILVDDCGSDNSIEIAERLIAEYNGPIEFKVLHHEYNRGLSAARNTGMDAANGKYVYFLDSDDWISDDCIEKLASPLQEEKVDIVIGDYKTIGELPYTLELSLEEGRYYTKPIDSTFCNKGVYVMAWNKLYRKTFLLANGLQFEEGRVHEDEILAFELSCVDKSFFVVQSVTYFYRIRENSIITTSNVRKKVEGYVGAYLSIHDLVKKYEKTNGIFDFYLESIRNVFGWISKVEIDAELLGFVDERIRGFLDVVPSLICLKNKHNKLVYFKCKKEQTYSRYHYVTGEYANKLKGRIVRNLLDLLPAND